eukprot:c15626_g1_i3.p1 GENE.c15626_g1_i3~~c15626_g1_i3.p1  ORF type:complete len:162 (+),score=30.10 c15626_g1_i3:194-679(+)
MTPLDAACQGGHVAVAGYLLLHTNPPPPIERLTWLMCVACQEGHLELLKTLVAGYPEAVRGRVGDITPLYSACSSGHAHIVKYLIANVGLDVNANSTANEDETFELTPLRIACHQGHLGVVRVLVGELGAVVDNFCDSLALSNGHCEPHTHTKRKRGRAAA